MSDCGCGHAAGAGPFAEGRALVEFVSQAHGGTLRQRPVPNGGLEVFCGGCSALCSGYLRRHLPDLRRGPCGFTTARE